MNFSIRHGVVKQMFGYGISYHNLEWHNMDEDELAIAYFMMNLSHVDYILESNLDNSDKVRLIKEHMDKIKKKFPDTEHGHLHRNNNG